MSATLQDQPTSFNGPIEIGLRALCLLTEAYPAAYSLQRLVVLDYLVVHTDDLPDGPPGLHPKTPHRSGEILVRRTVVQQGLLLYGSRQLIDQQFRPDGVYFAATERSASFLDSIDATYVADLRARAAWLVGKFAEATDLSLSELTNSKLGNWGAEFLRESVLWSEATP